MMVSVLEKRRTKEGRQQNMQVAVDLVVKFNDYLLLNIKVDVNDDGQAAYEQVRDRVQ
jgi:hypothetical protein